MHGLSSSTVPPVTQLFSTLHWNAGLHVKIPPESLWMQHFLQLLLSLVRSEIVYKSFTRNFIYQIPFKQTGETVEILAISCSAYDGLLLTFDCEVVYRSFSSVFIANKTSVTPKLKVLELPILQMFTYMKDSSALCSCLSTVLLLSQVKECFRFDSRQDKMFFYYYPAPLLAS